MDHTETDPFTDICDWLASRWDRLSGQERWLINASMKMRGPRPALVEEMVRTVAERILQAEDGA
jgi:hypothetical protein